MSEELSLEVVNLDSEYVQTNPPYIEAERKKKLHEIDLEL
jgi:hypothetical protein